MEQVKSMTKAFGQLLLLFVLLGFAHGAFFFLAALAAFLYFLGVGYVMLDWLVGVILGEEEDNL